MGKRTSRSTLLLALLLVAALGACDDGEASSGRAAPASAPPENEEAPPEAEDVGAARAEAALRAFVAAARTGELAAVRGHWHPESRHRVDIERLVVGRPNALSRLLDGVESALDAGVALEVEPLRPTDRGGSRRSLRYACVNRAGEARRCELQMLTDHAGRWYVDDID